MVDFAFYWNREDKKSGDGMFNGHMNGKTVKRIDLATLRPDGKGIGAILVSFEDGSTLSCHTHQLNWSDKPTGAYGNWQSDEQFEIMREVLRED